MFQAHSHLGSIILKKTHHWLDIAEYATLVGLGVGSITSFVSSQFFYASAPLSLLVLLNLASRNRLEQEMQRRTQQAIAQIDHKVSQSLDRLNQQIQTLPTTEAMGGLRKSMLIKNRELAERLAGEIRTLQDSVQAVLVMIERLKLGTVREDLDVVRSQYDSLNEGVISLTNQVQQMVTSGRFDQMEQAIAQLRDNARQLEANIQSLADQTKPTLTSLQDQITHLNRQFQKLPPPFDSSALKQEVAELMRMVSDLVPKRDLSALSTELHRLQAQQESQLAAEETLRRKLQEIHLQLQSRPTKSSLTSLQNQINHLNRQFQKLPPPFDPTHLRQEVAKLLQIVSGMVPRRDFSGLITQVKALQQQQEFQLKIERTLQKELQSLSQQLQELMENPPVATGAATGGSDAPPQAFRNRLEAVLQQELSQISQQLQVLPNDLEPDSSVAIALQQELATINRQLQHHPNGSQYEFVLDFKADHGVGVSSGLSNSRRVLEEALERSQERLIIILPWSSLVNLDDTLLGQMEAFLRQKRQLHVGWCHQTEQTQPRFLKAVQQRWEVQPERQSTLQETLQRLLQLKRIDPQRFQFKIMGTRENFLVSDQQYAVLGIDAALVGTSLPDVELKLRTTDGEVVQQLSQRFGQPAPKATDVAAHWNLAVTRYDLGDRQAALESCNHILSVTPDDANAFNFRGIIHYEMGDRTAALADFEQAIKCDPHNVSPYCNRGYIRAEQEDQLGAIADYSAALRVDATSGIPYFLRGMSCQKFGEIEGALADYDEALRRVPNSPVLFYYRGLTRPKIGDFGGAIGDLQQALEGFHRQGNDINARKVQSYLEQLRQAHPHAIVPPPNLPASPRPAPEPTTPASREPADEAEAAAEADPQPAELATELAEEVAERSPNRPTFNPDEGIEFSTFSLPSPEDKRVEGPATDAETASLLDSNTLPAVPPLINGTRPVAPELEDADAEATSAHEAFSVTTTIKNAEMADAETAETTDSEPIKRSESETPLETADAESTDAEGPGTEKGTEKGIETEAEKHTETPTESAEAKSIEAESTEPESAALETIAQSPFPVVLEETQSPEHTEHVGEAEAIVVPQPGISELPPAVVSADTVILLPPVPDLELYSMVEHQTVDPSDPANERLADLDDPFSEAELVGEETTEDEIDLTAVNRAMNPAAAKAGEPVDAASPSHEDGTNATYIQDMEPEQVEDMALTEAAATDRLFDALDWVDDLAEADSAEADSDADDSDADDSEMDVALGTPSIAYNNQVPPTDEEGNPFRLPADPSLLLDAETAPSEAASTQEDTSTFFDAAATIDEVTDTPAIALGPISQPDAATASSNATSLDQEQELFADNSIPAITLAPETEVDTLLDFFGHEEEEPEQPEATAQEPQADAALPDEPASLVSHFPTAAHTDPTTEPPSNPAIEPGTLGETLASFFDLDEDDLANAQDIHLDAERLASLEADHGSPAAIAPQKAIEEEPETTTDSLFDFFDLDEAVDEVLEAPARSVAPNTADNPFGEFATFDTATSSEEPEQTESAETNAVVQRDIPLSNGRHPADPATLTLSNFLDDLNQAGELDPAIYRPETPAEEEPAPGSTNEPSVAGETPPANPANDPDAETLSDFCNLF